MSNRTAKAFAAGLVLLFLITATSAYAQAPPAMTEVSGQYVNENAGVQITFPDGYSGFEIPNPSITMVATALGGMSDSDPAAMKAITLLIADKSQNKDPNDPKSFTNEVNDCNDPTIKSRTAAGVQAVEVTAECPNTLQTFRMVSVQTDSNWIVVMYMAPTADFESQVPNFDSAVSSLQVQGAVDTQASTTGGSSGGGNSGDNGNNGNSGSNLGQEIKSVIQSVLVKGKNMDIALKTTSTISNFKLEEQNKMLSFTVDGQSGTQGSTEIPIGKVLEGPYSVAIDGKATTAFEVANEGSVDAVLKLSYTHSTHDVTVTGTNVVPEFPIAIVGAIGAVIGVVAIIGRTSLFRPKV